MVTEMRAVKNFVRDYYRLLIGQPLVGYGDAPTSQEKDGRGTAERFSRGNVAVQAGRFVTKADLDRERREVAEASFRN